MVSCYFLLNVLLHPLPLVHPEALLPTGHALISGNGRENLPDKPLFVFSDAAAMLVLSSWQRILRCKDLYADRTYWRTS